MRQAPGVGLSQVLRAQGKVAGGDGWWRRIIPRIARGSDADLRRRELVVVLVAASAQGVCLPFGCTTTTTTLHAACYKLQPLEVQVCGRGKERSARPKQRTDALFQSSSEVGSGITDLRV